MSAERVKSNSRIWVGGLVALALALIAMMVLLPTEKIYGSEHWGWVAGTFWYWGSFGFLYDTRAALIGQGFFYFSILCAIFALVKGILGKKMNLMLDALFLLIAGFVVSYVADVIFVGIDRGWADAKSTFGGMAALLLSSVGLILLIADVLISLLNEKIENVKNEVLKAVKGNGDGLDEDDVRLIVKDELASLPQSGMNRAQVEELIDDTTLKEEAVREIVREEIAALPKDEPKQEQPQEEPKEEAVDEESLTEERVREIVKEELESVVIAAPVKEEEISSEESEEEDDEEEDDIEENGEENGEEEADDNQEPEAASSVAPATNGKYPASRRRTASFETKLKGSDYDLRHKYYDLRDYIKSYGVNNRISRPGDTFSLHREKLAFIAISGKHLKVSLALNPEDYVGSTIPVGTNTSKKFADMPLVIKVKSDLSFRRAKKLIDDLMASKDYKQGENN